MKKYRYEITVSAVILLALVCAGCTKFAGDPGNDTLGLFVYQDAETGCEYVAQGSNGGLAPRIDSDGLTHRGCRKTDRVSP